MFEDKRDLYVHNLRYHTAAIRQATEALINGECKQGGWDEEWSPERLKADIKFHRECVDRAIDGLDGLDVG